ncbi:MAG: hypothetical protein O2V44_05630, partial [Candidatus Bathyarchaeota archaeon]|nr:hypothetical protein [Candidatus Bathyarchaeota archaeon]
MVKKGGKKEAKRGDFSEERVDHAFFYPFSLGNRSLEELDAKEVEGTIVEIEEKFLDSLKVINEEILQLSEFLIEDKKLAQELCRLVKPILKHLNLSFTIPARAIPLFEKTDQIILNEDGHLIFVYEKNKIDSKALKEYPPEIVLLVFLNVIPKLGKVLKLYRRKVGMRVNFFEKIYRELENAKRAFIASNQSLDTSLEEAVEVDGVKKTLFSKSKDYQRKP